MAEEEKDDVKQEEDTTSPGNDQPEKKETISNEETQDEMVSISKSELEQLKEEKNNYREGLLSAKRKGRTLPGVDLDTKPPVVVDDFGGDDNDTHQEFITKKELTGRDQKSAIIETCKDSETDEHWDDIMFYYRPEHGQDDKEGMILDIQKAKKLWSLDNPKPKPGDQGKKVTADLAADKGLGSGKVKDTTPTPERKHIIPKKEKMDEWYK